MKIHEKTQKNPKLQPGIRVFSLYPGFSTFSRKSGKKTYGGAFHTLCEACEPAQVSERPNA
jgi:hypothetical protein